MRKKAKQFIALLIVFVIVFGSAPVSGLNDFFSELSQAFTAKASAEDGDGYEEITKGIFTYRIYDWGYTEVIGCSEDASGDIVFPASVNGHNVDAVNFSYIYFDNNITSITFSNGISNIVGTFWCDSIETIIIPESVTYISEYSFSYVNCDENGCFESIVVDEDNKCYKSVDGALFSKDGKILMTYPNDKRGDSYAVPDGVQKISQSCFVYNHHIKQLTLPASVIEIGEIALNDMYSLENIFVDENNPRYFDIDGILYDNIKSELLIFPRQTGIKNLVIPQSIKSVKANAFSDNKGLETVRFLNANCKIGRNAFYHCTALKSVALPENLTELESCVFGYCQRLENISIPDSVTKIGDSAFDGCTNLTSIVLPTKLSELGAYAFGNCSSLNSISIPDSVTKIDRFTFIDCSSLTSVRLPEELCEIGEYAFYGCSSLTSILIPDGVTKIDRFTFYHCSGLTSVRLPKELCEIGEYAFCGCSSLTSIAIPDSVTKIDRFAFNGCSSLTSVQLPEKLCEIGEDVFSWTGIFWDDLNWEDGSFYVDNYLIKASFAEEIVFVKSGTKCIAENAFTDNDYLDEVWLPGTLQSIGSNAFSDIDSELRVIATPSIVSCCENAFENSPNVTVVCTPGSFMQNFCVENSIDYEYAYNTFKYSASTSGSNYTGIFALYNIETSWQKAKYICEALGGHLATITTKNEDDLAKQLLSSGEMSTGYWLGATDENHEGTWEWITGEDFSYGSIFGSSPWGSNNPSNTEIDGKTENYLEYYKSTSLWNDAVVDRGGRGFICEFDENMAPPENIIEYNGHIYMLFNQSASWLFAKSLCEDMGGHLVTITDAEEQEVVERLIVNQFCELYFIGLTDSETEGTWKWVTGEPFDFSNWMSNVPDNSTAVDKNNGEDYAQIYSLDGKFGFWNDINNSNYSSTTARGRLANTGFICEIEPNSLGNLIAEGDFGGNHYEVYSGPLSFAAAEYAAMLNGGELADINSEEEYNFVKSLAFDCSGANNDTMADYFWLGALRNVYNTDISDYYTIPSFSPLTYGEWESGSPSRVSGREGWYGKAFIALGSSGYKDMTANGPLVDGTSHTNGIGFIVEYEDAEKNVTIIDSETGSELWKCIVNYGEKFRMPDELNEYGYNSALYKDEWCNSKWLADDVITADTTLYLKREGKKIKIFFYTDGGEMNIPSKTVEYGKKYGTLPTPVKEGYTFAGWYTSLYNGGYVDSSSEIYNTENIVLYAKYEEPVRYWFSVECYTERGWICEGRYYAFGEQIDDPPVPYRKGYTFTGWSPEYPATMPNHDVYVCATWKKNEFDLSELCEDYEMHFPTADSYDFSSDGINGTEHLKCVCCGIDLGTFNVVKLGQYPQSRVDDAEMINNLNSLLSDDWISFDFFSADERDYISDFSKLTGTDCMEYQDVELNGSKFRAVRINEYRLAFDDLTELFNMGYYKNNIYWFLFEPVIWRIVDDSTGYAVAEMTLDVQSYSNTIFLDENENCYSDPDFKNPISRYSTSYLRKWLNNDFYNTVFSEEEKKQIADTQIYPYEYNNDEYVPIYSDSCFDKVSLAYNGEMLNEMYNSSEQRSFLFSECTDYSNCMGCLSLNKNCEFEAAELGMENVLSGIELPKHSMMSWLSVVSDDEVGWLIEFELDSGSEENLLFNLGIRPAITVNFSSGDSQKNITGISPDTSSAQLEFETGDDFSSYGLAVDVTYSDGSTEKIHTGFDVSEPVFTSAGRYKITVTYRDYSASYYVTVTESEETHLFCEELSDHNIESTIIQAPTANTLGTAELKCRHCGKSFGTVKIAQLGSYPQTRVEDEALISSLNQKVSSSAWISYDYESASENTDTNCMFYQDIELDGKKYRAVLINNYRSLLPHSSKSFLGDKYDFLFSEDVLSMIYGIPKNTICWYKFEPIYWRIIDEATGLAYADSALDAQPAFEHVYYDNDSKSFYSNPSCTEPLPEVYEDTDISRWLNSKFYNSAFNDSEKDVLVKSGLHGTEFDDSYDGYTLTENDLTPVTISLPSAAYFYDMYKNDVSSVGTASDYTLSQGLFADMSKAGLITEYLEPDEFDENIRALFASASGFPTAWQSSSFWDDYSLSFGSGGLDAGFSSVSSINVAICPAVRIDLDKLSQFTEEPPPPETTVSAEKVYVLSGSTVSVPVSIENNPGIMGCYFKLSYDPSVLTPINVESGEVFGGGSLESNFDSSPNGTLKINYTAGSESNTDGTLFNVVFKASENTHGTQTVKVSYVQRNTFNENYENVVLNCEDFDIEITNPTLDGTPEFKIENFSAESGSEVVVPVSIENSSSMTSFVLKMTYDAEKLTPVSATRGDVLSSNITNNASAATGTLNLRWSGTAISTDGNIAYITFKVNEDFVGETELSLAVTSAKSSYTGGIPAIGCSAVLNVTMSALNLPYIYSDTNSSMPGNTVDVPVYIKNNTGIEGVGLNIDFDESLLTLVSVNANGLLSGGTFDYSNVSDGSFKIIWYSTDNMIANGLLFTMTFRVADNAPFENIPINIVYDEADTFNSDWETVELESQNISVNIVPDKFTATFVSDGNVISVQEYNLSTEKLDEPDVPSVPFKLNGRWEKYDLSKGGNIIINAIYDSPSTILPASKTIVTGKTEKIISSSNYTVERKEWYSDNPNVAAVDSRGNITAIADGECCIKVTCYGKDDLGNTIKSSDTMAVSVITQKEPLTFKEWFRQQFDYFFNYTLYDIIKSFAKVFICYLLPFVN